MPEMQWFVHERVDGGATTLCGGWAWSELGDLEAEVWKIRLFHGQDEAHDEQTNARHPEQESVSASHLQKHFTTGGLFLESMMRFVTMEGVGTSRVH